MNETNAQLFEKLNRKIKRCKRCQELAQTRRNVVPGAGNVNALIMFVGEAPGEDEDRQGIPFVGKAGKVLNNAFDKIGISRDDIFIGNVLKCRPPGNRDPLDTEIDNCREFLHAQIALIRPLLICTLGNPALKTLIDKRMTIGKVHGKVISVKGINFFPIFHPASTFHGRTNMENFTSDFAKLKKVLQEM